MYISSLITRRNFLCQNVQKNEACKIVERFSQTIKLHFVDFQISPYKICFDICTAHKTLGFGNELDPSTFRQGTNIKV